MANQWLRLWHDMPTDPKWRTIARVSGQRIGDVIAVFTHMLVCASNATERGRTQSLCSEDVASALDIDTEQVEQIIAAMQGRVLDGDLLKGWEIRQVSREDGSAGRSKAWREAKKQEKTEDLNAGERERTHPERNRTQTERKQTPDKDKDKDTDIKETNVSFARATRKCPAAFEVTDELRGWAQSDCPLVSVDLETAKLRDHTYKTAIKDWPGAWRNWLRKAQQDAALRKPKPPAQAPQKSFAERDREDGWRRWEQQTGRSHPDRLAAANASGSVIDVTPRILEISQ